MGQTVSKKSKSDVVNPGETVLTSHTRSNNNRNGLTKMAAMFGFRKNRVEKFTQVPETPGADILQSLKLSLRRFPTFKVSQEENMPQIPGCVNTFDMTEMESSSQLKQNENIESWSPVSDMDDGSQNSSLKYHTESIVSRNSFFEGSVCSDDDDDDVPRPVYRTKWYKATRLENLQDDVASNHTYVVDELSDVSDELSDDSDGFILERDLALKNKCFKAIHHLILKDALDLTHLKKLLDEVEETISTDKLSDELSDDSDELSDD